MTCAVPIEYKIDVSLEDCHKLCINKTPSCLTLQYNLYKKSCQIFNIPSPFDQTTGKLGVKNINKNNNLNLRERRQINSNSVGPTFNNNKITNNNDGVCEITMLPSIGYSFIVFDQECYKMQIEFTSEVNTQLQVVRTNKNTTIRPESNKKAMGVGFVEEDNNEMPPNPFKNELSKVISNDISKTYETFSNNDLIKTRTKETFIKVIPLILDCPDSGRAKVMITDGIEITNQQPIITFHLPNSEKCLYTCRINGDLDGKRLQKQCRSASYNKINGICYLYDDLLIPTGSFDYNPNRQNIYFEKICLPEEEAPIGCDEGIIKLPQHVLLGHATEVIDAPNQGSCIRNCITSLVKYGFKCTSLMYFYEFDKFNCILNLQNRNTKKDFFRQELRQKVDYIELPSCLVKNNDKITQANDDLKYSTDDPIYDESEWGVWSNCDSSMTKTRTRFHCKTCSIKSEIIPCVENDKDFHKFVDMYDDDKTN
uniref:PAN-1 domain and Apple-like domain-containing protein n=1 Tax=Parastrongyloides trichosuri TaxID=131310 RepID=A0A0N4ZPS9_PARTI